MEENKLKQFTFYDFYADIIDNMKDDAAAGRMIKRICLYMFGDEEIGTIKDKLEKFLWSNLLDELQATKQIELAGKISKSRNSRMQHFTFPLNFYEAIELMNDEQSGQYIKAICHYMFKDEAPQGLSQPVSVYFSFAKRKLDTMKQRKYAGRKKTIPAAVSTKQNEIKTFGLTDFLAQYPNVKDDIYSSSRHIMEVIDWKLLAEKLPQSSYAECKSLYQITVHYTDIIGKLSVTKTNEKCGTI